MHPATLLKKQRMPGTYFDNDTAFLDTWFSSVIAAKGILMSAIATGVLGFITTILFLFCTPGLDTVFALNAPQPFVQIYALALGKKASIFMTILAVLGLILVQNDFFSSSPPH